MTLQVQSEIEKDSPMVRAPFISLNDSGAISYSLRHYTSRSRKSGWEKLLQDLRLCTRAMANPRPLS